MSNVSAADQTAYSGHGHVFQFTFLLWEFSLAFNSCIVTQIDCSCLDVCDGS